MIPRFPAERLAAAALVLALASGCAQNPVSGQPEFALMSTEKEREIGAAEAKKIEEIIGFLPDTKLVSYVQAVGRRLAQQSPRADIEYTVQVVEMAESNAFSLPGGYIFISRGMLALINSEDELGGILGHEIAHVAARHGARRLNVAVATAPLRLATGIAGLATSVVSPRLGMGIAGLGEAASGLVLAPYSREQEREADRVGQDIAAKAGYDPNALSTILATVEREEELRRDGPPRQSFFASHPAIPERVQNTVRQAGEFVRAPAAPIATDRTDFLARLEGLLIGADPAQGVFVESRFLHPELDFTLRFPPGWTAENRGAAVVGRTREKDAILVLTVAGKGSDPMGAARAFEQEVGVKLQNVAAREINGLRAVRATAQAQSPRGSAILDLTWVAHGGLIYHLAGIYPSGGPAAYPRLVEESALSFRPLTAADRAQIREARMRIVQAREGERLEDLVRRTRSVWSPAETAVANALPAGARLEAGQLVKVAILQPYRGSPGR